MHKHYPRGDFAGIYGMEEFRICIERRAEAEGMLQARKKVQKSLRSHSPSLRQKNVSCNIPCDRD